MDFGIPNWSWNGEDTLEKLQGPSSESEYKIAEAGTIPDDAILFGDSAYS